MQNMSKMVGDHWNSVIHGSFNGTWNIVQKSI